MTDADHTDDRPPAGGPMTERELLELSPDELLALAGLLELFHVNAPDDVLEAVEAVSRAVNRRLFDLGVLA